MTTDAVTEPQASAPASQAEPASPSVHEEVASLLSELDQEPNAATPEAKPGEGTDTGKPEGTASSKDESDQDIEALLKSEVRESIAEKARAEALKELEDKRAEEAQERARRQAQQAHRNGYTQAFQRTTPALRNWATEQGHTEEETNLLVNTFAEHHRLAIETASWELTDRLVEHLQARVPEGEREALAYDGSDADLGRFLDRYDAARVKDARKGYKSEAEVKQAVLDGKVDLFRKLRDNPALLNSRGGPRRSNGGSPGGAVHYSTKTEARNLHAQNLISNAEMRAVNADASIPE